MIRCLKNAFRTSSYPANPQSLPVEPTTSGELRELLRRSILGLIVVFSFAALPSQSFGQGSDDIYGDEDMDEEMGYGSGSGDYDEDDMYGDDMYGEEDMYGSGSGYGGGGRSSRGGSSIQDLGAGQLSQVLAAAFKSTDLASLANPEAAPPVESGPVLLNESTVAYAKGDYPLALNLYFGHIVAEYEKAQNQLALAKASRLMKQRSRVKGRPLWSLRWGISFTLRGDATDPQPIEQTAAREAPTRVARGRGRGSFDGGGFGEGDYGGMDEQYGMEMEDSYGGEGMEADMDMEMQMEMDQMYAGDPGMMGGRGRPGMAQAPPPVQTPGARLAAIERTMLSAEADAELKKTLGEVASAVAGEFDKRYSQGDYGRALTDVTEESGSRETVSGDFVDLMEMTDPLPLWRPGLVYLGQGASADTTKLAKKADLDMLIHLDVYLKPLGNGEYTDNISRCRLIHVPSEKSLGVSKPVSSIDFMKESRAKGTGSKEYIDEQMSNYWGIVDKYAITSDLPSLTPEYAQTRVGELLASGGGRNLRTLAEIRLYQSQQLLSEDEVIQAFDIVGGEEGLQLLFANEEERLRIVHKWASGESSDE